MKKLEGVEFKKKSLTTEYTVVAKDVFRERFQAQQPVEEEEDPRSFAERLADQVTPLHKYACLQTSGLLFFVDNCCIRMPYEEQLMKKHKTGIAHLNKFKKRMAKLTDLSKEGRAQIAWAFDKYVSHMWLALRRLMHKQKERFAV